MASIQFRIVVRGVNWPLLVELQAELFDLALNSENLEIQDLVWAPGEHPTIDSSYLPAKNGNHQAQTHGGKHRHGRSEHHDNNDPAFLTPWEPAGLVSALFS